MNSTATTMTRAARRHAPRALPALAAAAVLVGVTSPAAAAAPKDKQPLHDAATGEPVTGAFSMLDRSEDAIATTIRTAATPGHAVTIWYGIFNLPGQCSDDACGEDDVFVNGDPAQGFNFDQIEATRISLVYGGDGAVANPAGRVQLDGGLAEGEIPTGTNQVVIGHPDDNPLVPGPLTGLEDAQAAEVHIVLQDHGTAHQDPKQLESQLSGFRTACNPDCVDIQLAVHLP